MEPPLCQFDLFPTELWAVLLPFLNPVAVTRLAATCRRHRDVVYELVAPKALAKLSPVLAVKIACQYKLFDYVNVSATWRLRACISYRKNEETTDFNQIKVPLFSLIEVPPVQLEPLQKFRFESGSGVFCCRRDSLHFYRHMRFQSMLNLIPKHPYICGYQQKSSMRKIVSPNASGSVLDRLDREIKKISRVLQGRRATIRMVDHPRYNALLERALDRRQEIRESRAHGRKRKQEALEM